MDPMLKEFLADRMPLSFETATWGTIDLQIRHYASNELPPDHLVTSVRAVVLSSGSVLVIREPTGDEHIVPGGRRKAGESLEDTVRREVLEETCWTVADLSILAVGHFHITGVVPEDYPYPSPDFLQLIYLTKTLELQDERAIEDDWVAGCEMVPVDSVSERPISEAQQLLLAHALSRAGFGRKEPSGPDASGEAV